MEPYDYRFRWVCAVLSLVALAGGWFYYALDDTVSAWVMVLTIATSGVLAVLGRER